MSRSETASRSRGPRTIIDISRTLKGRALEHIVDLADQRGLVDFQELRAANSASLKAVLQNYRPAPTGFERDRENDVTLTVKGWRVMRFTWRKVEEKPAWVAAAIRTGAAPLAA
jgi:hypothetical protein